MKQKRAISVGLSCLIAFLALFIAARMVTAKPASSTQTQAENVLTEDIKWTDNLKLKGIQTAFSWGDPGSAELYVLMNKMDRGAILQAHTHPDDRVTTVISGVMYYGTGSQFTPDDAKPYPVGSVIYTTANTPHFIWAKDAETVVQQTGLGPTEIDFLR